MPCGVIPGLCQQAVPVAARDALLGPGEGRSRRAEAGLASVAGGARRAEDARRLRRAPTKKKYAEKSERQINDEHVILTETCDNLTNIV